MTKENTVSCSMIGNIPYRSRGIFSKDKLNYRGNNPRMVEVTREYVLEIIKLGIERHGSIAQFERIAGLKAGHIKDIWKWPDKGGTEIPRADRWHKILLAAGVEEKKPQERISEVEIAMISMLKGITTLLLKKKYILPQELEGLFNHAGELYHAHRMPNAVKTVEILHSILAPEALPIEQELIQSLVQLSPVGSA